MRFKRECEVWNHGREGTRWVQRGDAGVVGDEGCHSQEVESVNTTSVYSVCIWW